MTDAVRDLGERDPCLEKKGGFERSSMADGRHVLVNAFDDPTSSCGGQDSVACAQPSSVGCVEGHVWCLTGTILLQPPLSQFPEHLSTVFSAVTPGRN